MFKKSMVILICIFMAACTTTYHGLRPISPAKADLTSDVRPTFKWQASQSKDAKYDIIIYDLELKCSDKALIGCGPLIPTFGARVYYRENIDRPEHRIEIDLIPGNKYFWSVRERLGERVGEWSRYDFNYGQYGSGTNWFYELTIKK